MHLHGRFFLRIAAIIRKYMRLAVQGVEMFLIKIKTFVHKSVSGGFYFDEIR